MSKGISLHIGINHVDPKRYGGWDGALSGCINDAKAMRDIAASQGFDERSLLVDSQATAARVLQKIADAASRLSSGDIYLITYSGHGGSEPDLSGDEGDGRDETWVLYDRQLFDDELALAWAAFKAGVRIVVVSDSCHSGTVIRSGATPDQVQPHLAVLSGAEGDDDGSSAPAMSIEINATILGFLSHVDLSKVFRAERSAHQAEYTAIKASSKPATINASVVLLGGCRDDQLSGDTSKNGVFTGALLQVWDGGAFKGTYPSFVDGIRLLMPVEQTPSYDVAGAGNLGFWAQRPFTLASTPAMPTIRAAVEWDADTVYFFFDGYYIRYDLGRGRMAEEYPLPIEGDWPGLWTDRVDSAVNWGNGKVYFFRGTEYCKYDVDADKVDAGYPRSSRKGWSTLWPTASTLSIDAAVRWDTTCAYFFRGSEYTRCNLATQNAEPGYPRVTAKGWPGVWTGTIDAAVNWGNGKVYLFKGGQYIRYDIKADATDSGFPRAIPADWKDL